MDDPPGVGRRTGRREVGAGVAAAVGTCAGSRKAWRFLCDVGAPNRLVNLVAHHSCTTLEAELWGLSEELAEFEDERPALRDALWWAEMTTMPDGQETTAAERIAEIQSRYGQDDLVSRFIRHAWGDLSAAVERTERRLGAVWDWSGVERLGAVFVSVLDA